MVVNTDGEETREGSTVQDGLEPNEVACEFVIQPGNEKKLPEEVACDIRIHDQKPVHGSYIQPIFPMYNMPQRHTSDILNTDHNEAKEQHRNAGDSALSALSQRHYSNTVEDASESMQLVLVAPNTDTSVDVEERLSPPSPAEIMELLDTENNDDWDAIYETLQEEMQLCDTEMIKQDLPINPDIDLTDEEGYTQFYKAALEGRLESVDDLISQGANPNKPSKGGLTPLHAATQEGHGDIVDYLILQGADVNAECEMGRTPLHLAAGKGHIGIMESLLAEGTDVNKKDNTGWTSFNAAVHYGHLEAVKYLLSKGAKQSRYDDMTPLYLAAQSGHLDIVKFFISEGADVIEENNKGQIPLHSAAIHKNIEVMDYLIQQRCNVNKTDDNGWTPFNAAVVHGHLEAVKYLIAKGAKQNRYDGMTALYAAAQFGHLDLVKFFISDGSDVNEESDKGMIPLHGAAIHGNIEVMEYLIKQGSDVNKADADGNTPLISAAENDNLEAVTYLISKGATQEIFTPLSAAALCGHLDKVKYLISEGGDVNEENDDGIAPLHCAALVGNTEVMEYLIQQGTDVNKAHPEGGTAFNAAVQCGHLEAVKYLIDKGAKPNRCEGMSPLYTAAKFGHLDLVKFFISEGADVNEEDENGRIPLHGAAIKGSIEIMEYLIQQGSDVTKFTPRGWTPFNAAVQYGHLEIVKYLIDKGARQNSFDGITPLYSAVRYNHLELVKFFVSRGANVNEESDTGLVPLHSAAGRGHTEVLKYLIQQGSDVNKCDAEGWTPFHTAVRNGNLEEVKFLLENGARSTRIGGLTPLYIATQYGHTDVVEFLVSKGFDLNETSNDRKTPLHAACYNGNIDVVKCLVVNNANVSEQNEDGWTPLHAAAQEGHIEVVKFLILKGADITAKDIDGMTPLQAAEKGGHSTVMKYLTLRWFDSLNEDTSDLRYGSYHRGTQRHHSSSKCEALLEDEDRYDSEGKTIKSPEKRFASEQSSDEATTESMDDYSVADTDEKDIPVIHNGYLPTLPPLLGNGENGESNPFVSARLKFPENTATTAKEKQVNGSKGSVPVERKSCKGRDHSGNICPTPYESFSNSTEHYAFPILHQPPTWKHGCFDQSFLHATETNYHPLEETEPRRHDILKELISSMNARNDQPSTGNEEKCERTILSNPLVDHPKSYDGNSFFTGRTSLHSEWKKKKKRRSVDSACSSFLVLVKSFLHMITALAIILAGSPVLVAGSVNIERVTLQAGQPAVIPFDIPRFPDNISQVYQHFTLGFGSRSLPFWINGKDEIEGFKSPSQLIRFTTSVAEMASIICVKVNIDPVNIIDQDMYVLRTFLRDSENFRQETVMKEILVQIPPGPAKCFITVSENNNHPYEVHCQTTTGSTETTLTCYQYGQRVVAKGEITDNGQVTRAVFLLPDQSPFSCCSHDVTSHVNVTMCNDFEWPPSNNHISSPTVNDPTLTPSVANAIDPIGNTDHASNTLVESQVDSGTCKLYMTSSVSLTIVLMMYLFFCS